MLYKDLKFFQKRSLQMPWIVIYYLLFGALAQLVAHHTGSVGVSGSNPLCSTELWRQRNQCFQSFSFAKKRKSFYFSASANTLQCFVV